MRALLVAAFWSLVVLACAKQRTEGKPEVQPAETHQLQGTAPSMAVTTESLPDGWRRWYLFGGKFSAAFPAEPGLDPTTAAVVTSDGRYYAVTNQPVVGCDESRFHDQLLRRWEETMGGATATLWLNGFEGGRRLTACWHEGPGEMMASATYRHPNEEAMALTFFHSIRPEGR
jgi:hypothetical protein